MSRAAHQARLLAFVDSDTDELSGLSAQQIKKNEDSQAKPMAPAKKPRGRPAANKVTKPAQKPTSRPNDKLTAAAAAAEIGDVVDNPKASKRGRKARPKDDDDATADAEEEHVVPSTKVTAKTRGRPKAMAALVKGDENEEASESTAQPAKRGRRAGTKSTRDEDSEIPETQPAEAMDIDTEEEKEEDEQFEDLPAPKQSVQRAARMAGNADADGGDPQIRRRLGEANRKYESLELKYRDLRDIGIKAAERNFDNLKKESEERANTATELIGNLKADLAAQRALVKEGQQDRKKLEGLEAKVAELTASLSGARQEAKTLSTKLAASRSAEAAATAATAKVPGSAIKGGTAAARAIATASSDAVQTAQMKEDLYGDLTGLIVRVVKRDSTGQVFDCIQTGRNGTLHFKLEVETESSGDNYEEAHFTYKPQLDSNRDRDLIDLLPDFLVEEIEFSRPHAAKFYSRVTKSLME
ncbi:chromosome segregation protein [Colletotrichum gloeosporioides Cg-14]|uniref:Chromosome segregation protein n=1 Tax=Colletotrichum gloeosporioides (strain Cg-14) TaxID=1237896 RepID=T0M1S7_COLGC|nr:chromosome segregation protein [Colletotrichum gloeosporioides Cg-14]